MAKKLNFLSRTLSYFWEIPIHKIQSQYDTELLLSLDKGRVKLSTSEAVYSFEDLYYCYTQAFGKLNIQKYTLRNLLVLGYGLGSIPCILDRKFQIYPQVTGVEIDQAIVEAAKNYGFYNQHTQILNQDAVEFVLQNKDSFDLICIDVFVGHRVPVEIDTKEFLTGIREALNNTGIVIFNRMNDDDKNRNQNKELIDRLKLIFPAVKEIHIRDNLMLVASNEDIPDF